MLKLGHSLQPTNMMTTMMMTRMRRRKVRILNCDYPVGWHIVDVDDAVHDQDDGVELF